MEPPRQSLPGFAEKYPWPPSTSAAWGFVLFLMEWAELRPLQSVVHHVQVVIVIAEDSVAVVNGHAA